VLDAVTTVPSLSDASTGGTTIVSKPSSRPNSANTRTFPLRPLPKWKSGPSTNAVGLYRSTTPSTNTRADFASNGSPCCIPGLGSSLTTSSTPPGSPRSHSSRTSKGVKVGGSLPGLSTDAG
jgi:hypothetical protein